MVLPGTFQKTKIHAAAAEEMSATIQRTTIATAPRRPRMRSASGAAARMRASLITPGRDNRVGGMKSGMRSIGESAYAAMLSAISLASRGYADHAQRGPAQTPRSWLAGPCSQAVHRRPFPHLLALRGGGGDTATKQDP